MSNRPQTVQSAQSIPDDEVIDIVGELSGVNVKTDKHGKTFYNIKLTGGGATLYGNVWLKWTPEPLIGKTVIARQARMGSYNGRRSFMAMRGASVEEFSEEMDAPPQQVPENRPSSAARPIHAPAQQAPVTALVEYAALYAECIRFARQTVSNSSFDDSPESIRNIASCFFIQAIRDGIKAGGPNNSHAGVAQEQRPGSL